jgi:hypothetical protein
VFAPAATVGIGFVTPPPAVGGLVQAAGNGIAGDFSTRSIHGSLLNAPSKLETWIV